MITKIITKTFFSTLKEMENNIESLENVVNAEVISFGNNEDGYFVETQIKYRGNKINE